MARKKNYTICINPDVYEGLRELVTARGHSMSGYIETLIRESYEQMKALKDVQSIDQITIGKMVNIFNSMMKGLEAEKAERKNANKKR